MDINKIQSDLKMTDLYFSEVSLTRSANIEDGEYQIDVNKKIDTIDEHRYHISLTLTIEKLDLNAKVEAHADFLFESSDYNVESDIISINAVAIMFPFVRSQVALLTTQPDMTPIVLPAINVNKLFE